MYNSREGQRLLLMLFRKEYFMDRRKFLITNDDGIDADGIRRLAEAASAFGEVWVIAPDGQRSAASHSLTLRKALTLKAVSFPVPGVHAYSCDGLPADCVRLGILNIIPGGPDHVLSGINYGYNIAGDIQYSATAGAAFEAAFRGIHTVAFSEDAEPEHPVTDRYLKEVLGHLLDCPLKLNQIWNVNFPSGPLENCRGIRENCRVSTDMFYLDSYEEAGQEEGISRFQVIGARQWKATPGTDLSAILEGCVSVGIVNNVG